MAPMSGTLDEVIGCATPARIGVGRLHTYGLSTIPVWKALAAFRNVANAAVPRSPCVSFALVVIGTMNVRPRRSLLPTTPVVNQLMTAPEAAE